MEKVATFMSNLSLIWQRSFYAFVSLVFLFLLAYNGATIFCIYVPFPAKSLPESAIFTGKPTAAYTLPSAQHPVEKGSSNITSSSLIPLLHNNQSLVALTNRTKRRRIYKSVIKILHSEAVPKEFKARVVKFFKANSSDSSCKFRFFMTWISSAESLGDREMLSIQSVVRTHPNGCLIIVSNSLDSPRGMQILRPFSDNGHKVTAISPDFNYVLKNTAAEEWYNQLKQGYVNPGEISLGQNLSNLLRIVTLLSTYGMGSVD